MRCAVACRSFPGRHVFVVDASGWPLEPLHASPSLLLAHDTMSMMQDCSQAAELLREALDREQVKAKDLPQVSCCGLLRRLALCVIP